MRDGRRRSNVCGNVLKGLMFVGANASGKTNAILAITTIFDYQVETKLCSICWQIPEIMKDKTGKGCCY